MSISLTRQRIYLWRKFRGITTKRALAKALRNRLAEMSKAEAYNYWKDPQENGVHYREKLVKKNRRERRMIVAVIDEMYHVPTENIFTNGPNRGMQTSFYRRYR